MHLGCCSQIFPIMGTQSFPKPLLHTVPHIPLALSSRIIPYSIRLALSEEHISLGNIEEAKKLAIEAMKISDHVRQPDSVFHAYAEGTMLITTR